MDLLQIPNLSKELSSGENSILRFGVCAMQGWRKRMEDTHITDISKGENGRFNIFGVFDGHGGKEVAQFVSNHFNHIAAIHLHSSMPGNLTMIQQSTAFL